MNSACPDAHGFSSGRGDVCPRGLPERVYALSWVKRAGDPQLKSGRIMIHAALAMAAFRRAVESSPRFSPAVFGQPVAASKPFVR